MLCALVATGLGFGLSSAVAQTNDPAPPLSSQQADLLLPVIEQAQILDAAKPSPTRLARYVTACRKLPRSDRLVAVFRRYCGSEGDRFTSGLRVPTCKSAPRCRARLTRYSSDLAKQATESRRLNRTLKAQVPEFGCRSALRVRYAALKTLTKLRSASRSLVRTVRSGTAKQVSLGVARFYAVDRSALLDHRGRYDAFRAACQ